MCVIRLMGIPVNVSTQPAVNAGRILKVNHAGEQGAVYIYAGQVPVSRMRAKTLVAELTEFKAHEENHRSIFAAELDRRALRRCRTYWACAVGGYALGVLSGLLGEKAIATTTVAVERVVIRHLHQQLSDLGDSDPAATFAISTILEEEQYHHDQSARRIEAPRQVDRVVGVVVSAATEAVIWIGMRV